MSETKPARPPQVTVAGWMVVAGSVAVVLMAFSQVTGLRSLETREAVEEYLSKPPGDVFGLGVQRALSLLRIGLMVAAACGAATAILGWQVLQRSRGARVALSLLAVPLFISGLVGGGVVAALVVAAIVMLWFQPARDWFDGVTRAPLPPPEPMPDPTRVSTRDPLLDLPPPTAPPLHPTPDARTARAAGAQRPLQVTWACIVAWVATATLFALFATFLADFVVDPNPFLEQFHEQNPEVAMTDAGLQRLVVFSCAVCLAWSVAAAGLAVLVWRRVPWAALALGVSAALSCLVLLPIPAAVATIVLLLRPASRAWLRR